MVALWSGGLRRDGSRLSISQLLERQGPVQSPLAVLSSNGMKGAAGRVFSGAPTTPIGRTLRSKGTASLGRRRWPNLETAAQQNKGSKVPAGGINSMLEDIAGSFGTDVHSLMGHDIAAGAAEQISPAASWSGLGLHPRLIRRLKELKRNTPTEIQSQSFERILRGTDVILNSPPGTGKTLCYLLPLVQRLYEVHDFVEATRNTPADNPLAEMRPWVLLNPTRDLCAQAVQMLQEIDVDGLVSVQSLTPFLDFPPSRSGRPEHVLTTEFKVSLENKKISPVIVNEKLQWGSVDLVVSTPQHFLAELRRFKGWPILPGCIILDEVDAQFHGSTLENTLLDIVQIIRPRHAPPALNIDDNVMSSTWDFHSSDSNPLAISAIPSSDVSPVQLVFVGATIPDGRSNSAGQRIILRWPNAMALRSRWSHFAPAPMNSPVTANTHWQFMKDDNTDAVEARLAIFSALFTKLKSTSRDLPKCILFTNSARSCRTIFESLQSREWPVEMLHGNLQTGRRMASLDKFFRGEALVLVATDLGARGLDFPDVELLINFDFPSSVQVYLHRCGRAGRNKKGFQILNFVDVESSVVAAAIVRATRQATRSNTDPIPSVVALEALFSRKRALNSRIDRNIKDEGAPRLEAHTASDRDESPIHSSVHLTYLARVKLWKQTKLAPALSSGARFARSLDKRKKGLVLRLIQHARKRAERRASKKAGTKSCDASTAATTTGHEVGTGTITVAVPQDGSTNTGQPHIHSKGRQSHCASPKSSLIPHQLQSKTLISNHKSKLESRSTAPKVGTARPLVNEAPPISKSAAEPFAQSYSRSRGPKLSSSLDTVPQLSRSFQQSKVHPPSAGKFHLINSPTGPPKSTTATTDGSQSQPSRIRRSYEKQQMIVEKKNTRCWSGGKSTTNHCYPNDNNHAVNLGANCLMAQVNPSGQPAGSFVPAMSNSRSTSDPQTAVIQQTLERFEAQRLDMQRPSATINPFEDDDDDRDHHRGGWNKVYRSDSRRTGKALPYTFLGGKNKNHNATVGAQICGHRIRLSDPPNLEIQQPGPIPFRRGTRGPSSVFNSGVLRDFRDFDDFGNLLVPE